jgi:hypothetical protein
MDYRQIVWIASYPKSGNTWLRCFLDAYLLGDVDINDVVTSLPDDLAARCAVGDGSNAAEFPIDIQMLTRPMAMLRLVREYNANKTVDIPLFVKTHNTHVLANGVELMPEALTKATVCIVRDPRDVLVSFAKHMGEQNYDTAIEHFLNKMRCLNDTGSGKVMDFISSWPAAVASFANADTHNVKVWRYEDMKANPVEVFAQILAHSGIAVDKERVARAVDTVERGKLAKQEAEKGFKESSKHAANQFFAGTGGWQGKLSPKQVRTIEKACASMMKRFNYERAFK